jgi:hypothetical protein
MFSFLSNPVIGLMKQKKNAAFALLKQKERVEPQQKKQKPSDKKVCRDP